MINCNSSCNERDCCENDCCPQICPCPCCRGPMGPPGPRGPRGPKGEPGTPAEPSEYAYIYNNTSQTIQINNPIIFNSQGPMSGKISHTLGTAEITIGTTGAYSIWFYVDILQPNQATLFVNSAPANSSTYGTSSGGLNNYGMAILNLQAGDVLTLRNFTSFTSTTLQTMSGGTESNVNASIMIKKIS